MKRTVTEVLRRGFDNCVANWPIIAIRIVESILFLIIAVLAVVAAIVPLALSIGLNHFNPHDADDAAEFIVTMVLQHWPVLIYILLLVCGVILLTILIHAFVAAGVARVYIDAERATANIAAAPRDAFRVFSGDRFAQGGKRGWWPVFWIYNIAWSAAAVIVLIPIVIGAAIMFLMRETESALIIAGCGTLVLTLMLLIVVSIVTSIWCQKAILVQAATSAGANESLGLAWRQFTVDAGRHIAIALIAFVVMMASSSLFTGFSMFAGMNDSPTFALTTFPIQMAGSILSSMVSAAITSWFVACLATLTAHPNR